MRAAAALLALLAADTGPPGPPPKAAPVVAVHDGDTLSVTYAGVTRSVRLLGCDAPELGHGPCRTEPGAVAARTALRALLRGAKCVALTEDKQAPDADEYGRLLRWLSVPAAGQDCATVTSGVDASAEMVRRGLARADWRHPSDRRAEMCALEAAASAAKLGIWGLAHNAKPSQCPKGAK